MTPWPHYREIQQRTRSPTPPGQERGSKPRACAHLALDQLVVPLYLEHVACLAAHGALGPVVAVTAGAVERSILHGQLGAVGGLTCEVHTAGEGRDKRVKGPLQSSCKIKANGSLSTMSGGPEGKTGPRRGQEDCGEGDSGESGHSLSLKAQVVTHGSNPAPRKKALPVITRATSQSLSFSTCQVGIVMIAVSIHCVSYLPGAPSLF